MTAIAGWQEQATQPGSGIEILERRMPTFAFCTEPFGCGWEGCAVAAEFHAENLAQQHVINTGHTVRLVKTTETAYKPKERP